MIEIRHSEERGKGMLSWLKSYHTFSFAEYHDAAWMSRGFLRVINEDYIQPGQGFDLHPHRDMEIITYVISGALGHQDSMGNQSIIRPGEIQRMSAGTGVRHSEFNSSDEELLHLLQIWIIPEKKGIKPSYEQRTIPHTKNQLILIAADHAEEGAVTIHQKIALYVGYFDAGLKVAYDLNNQDSWLQLIRGTLQVNELELHAGDGIWMKNEKQLRIQCAQNAEFLLFKMNSTYNKD